MKTNCCHIGTCPHCDPGIEAYYQKRRKEIGPNFDNYYEAKDIWYEYCELKKQGKIVAPKRALWDKLLNSIRNFK